MSHKLKSALSNPIWINHLIGDTYTMDGKPDVWKIAYYPIFEDGKTNEPYKEPRALIEKPMLNGTDFREVPLRYLSKSIPCFDGCSTCKNNISGVEAGLWCINNCIGGSRYESAESVS